MSHSARLMGRVGAGLLVALALVALLAPLIAAHDPRALSGAPYEEPSGSHLLGTDDVGHDLFSQLVHGARISLAVGLLSAVVAVLLGLAVALAAGYFRGRVDAALMRLVDLTLAFPFLVLVIVLAAFFGQGLWTTVLVIGAVLWAPPARILRSQAIKIREFQHVVAARAMGASPLRIIRRHILPRLAPLAAAQFVRSANIAVFIEAALAFLGLGDANRMSWGTMLFFANQRSAFLTDAWLWWVLPPGLALTMAMVGFALVGYALEERADPRLRRSARRRGGSIGWRVRGEPAGPPQLPGTALELRDLAIHYETPEGPARAVDGVDLTVGSGEIVGLVGESGSGKSTLAMAVLGLVRPPGRVADGRILLAGGDLRALPFAELARMRGREVALIPQSAMNSLNPAYPVRRQVAESAALTRPEDAAAARAAELLEMVGIAAARHGAYPHELSGGMRQRVAIAMAVANEPALVVADEPVTGLDVMTQARILGLLADLRDELGLAILLISHDLPAVARIADTVAVMYCGRIVESGPASLLTAAPAHPYTHALLASLPSLHGPRRPLVAIPGDPPDPADPPCGCRFEPRCPCATAECRAAEPPLLPPGDGRMVACLRETPDE